MSETSSACTIFIVNFDDPQCIASPRIASGHYQSVSAAAAPPPVPPRFDRCTGQIDPGERDTKAGETKRVAVGECCLRCRAPPGERGEKSG